METPITQRVKFLIKYLIKKDIAGSQEEIGALFGIKSKSQVSMLVNNKLNNDTFLNFLLTFAPEIDRNWLYNESVTEPFLKENEKTIKKVEQIEQPKETNLEKVIKELENNIQLLQKDVKYHADIADSRLQTINIQNKYIDNLEAQLQKK